MPNELIQLQNDVSRLESELAKRTSDLEEKTAQCEQYAHRINMKDLKLQGQTLDFKRARLMYEWKIDLLKRALLKINDSPSASIEDVFAIAADGLKQARLSVR